MRHGLVNYKQVRGTQPVENFQLQLRPLQTKMANSNNYDVRHQKRFQAFVKHSLRASWDSVNPLHYIAFSSF